MVFLSELKICLLDNKRIKRDHPFEHFHVGELNTKNYSIEEIVGKEKVSMNFLEGGGQSAPRYWEQNLICIAKQKCVILSSLI